LQKPCVIPAACAFPPPHQDGWLLFCARSCESRRHSAPGLCVPDPLALLRRFRKRHSNDFRRW
jgi:hypothetical protein